MLYFRNFNCNEFTVVYYNYIHFNLVSVSTSISSILPCIISSCFQFACVYIKARCGIITLANRLLTLLSEELLHLWTAWLLKLSSIRTKCQSLNCSSLIKVTLRRSVLRITKNITDRVRSILTNINTLSWSWKY